MVSTAAASAFYPIASLSPDFSAKNIKTGVGYGNLGGIRSKSAASGGLQVKANAQTSPNINGSPVCLKPSIEGLKIVDDAPSSPPPRTFVSQLPDCSMLLAAITTMLLTAEKQSMMLDLKTKRSDMYMDLVGLGRFVQDGLTFRQNFPIRSYEIGADGAASMETLMNHFQESSLNHFKSAGLLGDGFGLTPEMCKRNLIWVVARLHLVVDRYPTWGDVVQVDTWISASGKNGMRRDCLVLDSITGETLARASSVCVMMNKETRKLSKIPDEVRLEIELWFSNSDPVVEEDGKKLPKLDDSTSNYVRGSLTPKWSDMDINQHVNNVKYTDWILESAPLSILESHEVSSIAMEYRRECGIDSVLQSLTSMTTSSGSDKLTKPGEIECHHLLRLEDGTEIMRARSKWRPKRSNNVPFSGQLATKNV